MLGEVTLLPFHCDSWVDFPCLKLSFKSAKSIFNSFFIALLVTEKL